MKHPVLMCVYNNIELTKAAVESVLAQDVGELEVMIINNGSTDGTKEWLDELAAKVPCVFAVHNPFNISPCIVANHYLFKAFLAGRLYVLCVPNDVVLPTNFYAELLRVPRGIVTASMTTEREFPLFENARAVSECTPLAVVLWRRWVYDALIVKDGYFFDENLWHYGSDMDIALRISACGIRGCQLDIQYFHVGSASHLLAPPEDGDRMRAQADVDRATFEKKYGFKVDSQAYTDAAYDINFRG